MNRPIFLRFVWPNIRIVFSVAAAFLTLLNLPPRRTQRMNKIIVGNKGNGPLFPIVLLFMVRDRIRYRTAVSRISHNQIVCFVTVEEGIKFALLHSGELKFSRMFAFSAWK
ncbi:hypothetical protein CDAR_49911 [Caerostris darwini]|uniref:Uncharacterized protein n=1 Tax=Caerostris darwini TaxID=1538125 RepID=A0AAV4UI41_9ARAC|nr:hypothetical protein CDAR_49911 [Caerostris darwini]